jgi:hypothetical protein
VSEYFIVVVDLCHRMSKITQMSAFGKFTSTLSDADLKAFESRLNLWASSIKKQESVLVATVIEEEAQENSKIRSLSSKFSTRHRTSKIYGDIYDYLISAPP